jgi:hypothetical protein
MPEVESWTAGRVGRINADLTEAVLPDAVDAPVVGTTGRPALGNRSGEQPASSRRATAA